MYFRGLYLPFLFYRFLQKNIEYLAYDDRVTRSHRPPYWKPQPTIINRKCISHDCLPLFTYIVRQQKMPFMNLLSNESRVGKDIGLLILRVVFAFALVYGHGFAKLSTIFSGQEIQFFDPIGIGAKLSFCMAAFAEGICTIFLIAGLFSRYAAFILSLNFIVIFSFHAFIAKDGFGVLELRLLYLFCFVALIFTGPGRISLDQLFFTKKKNTMLLE